MFSRTKCTGNFLFFPREYSIPVTFPIPINFTLSKICYSSFGLDLFDFHFTDWNPFQIMFLPWRIFHTPYPVHRLFPYPNPVDSTPKSSVPQSHWFLYAPSIPNTEFPVRLCRIFRILYPIFSLFSIQRNDMIIDTIVWLRERVILYYTHNYMSHSETALLLEASEFFEFRVFRIPYPIPQYIFYSYTQQVSHLNHLSLEDIPYTVPCTPPISLPSKFHTRTICPSFG